MHGILRSFLGLFTLAIGRIFKVEVLTTIKIFAVFLRYVAFVSYSFPL